MRYEAWRASGREIELDGMRVFLRERGEGRALVFLHGFPTTSFDWADVIARLETRFRCVAFDFLGFGGTPPVARIDYAAQCDLAERVMRASGITRCVIVAHDYAVSVAQELLARRREGARSGIEIDGVVFMNGAIEPTLHRALPVQKLLAGPLGPWLAPVLVTKRTFARSMARLITRMDRFDVDEHWRGVRAHAARAPRLLHYIAERRVHAERWRAAFRDRSVPIALVWGTRDPVSGGHVLAWAREARPDAEIVALDVGHYPQVEATEDCVAAIERFVARVG
ncbi:alpha/beta fold hydrolase [Sandaracinus amylolyticus]|uniref:Hydrolase, alpha/beta fold family n=1 Tax=Sandaracinus amylolyticus TaxID=927083 RepID=A0A0F6W3A2_9BACT|nr:alpha/beta hydrolase [Sandaracinus amylolyticus]AKF06393.1 Hydrolase, alpha/beta fold family [Sandaracinus amylolyticus]